MIDLASEYWEAVNAARVEHYLRLEALGCSRKALACLAPRTGPFGVAKVRQLASGLYEPDENGEPAVIMPVMAEGDGIFTPEPYDLIAFHSNSPKRWWQRIGQAAALGEDLIACRDELLVVETPLDWIACAGECLCVLDWTAPTIFWNRLRLGSRLIVQTEILHQRLRTALTRTVLLPEMEVSHAA